MRRFNTDMQFRLVVELCAIRDGVADCDTLSYNDVCNLTDLIPLD